MRFTTPVLNVIDFFENLSPETQELIEENLLHMQFQYDFPEVSDDVEAAKLEPSDGDLEIMVSLFINGFSSGEQEYWYEDEDHNDKSLRLVWKEA